MVFYLREKNKESYTMNSIQKNYIIILHREFAMLEK